MTSTAAKTKAKNRRTDKEAEWSGDFKRWREEWEEKIRRSDAAWAKISKKQDEAAKKLGYYDEREGFFAEEDFADALEERGEVGGIALKEVRRRMKHHYEYDLVGVNGRAMIVGEVKVRMQARDVIQFAEERLPHFAKEFPTYARRKIYGMVCARHFAPGALRKAEKLRLFVVRLKNQELLVQNDKAEPVAQG